MQNMETYQKTKMMLKNQNKQIVSKSNENKKGMLCMTRYNSDCLTPNNTLLWSSS